MCAYSNIYDQYKDTWPYQDMTIPADPVTEQKVREWIEKYFREINKAKEDDKKNKRPDCQKPEAEKFEKRLLDVLERLEKKLK